MESRKDKEKPPVVKKYRFWFTYSTSKARMRGEDTYILKWKGRRYYLDSIACNVRVETYSRKTFPKWVFRGYASKITINNFRGEIS